MDYYPQPRPVLYGASAEEPPPQTQIAPVRTGPPRWPPAPPLADFAPEPDDWWRDGWHWQPYLLIGTARTMERPASFTLLGFLYGAATAYTCILLATSTLSSVDSPFAVGIEIAFGLLVTLSLWMPNRRGYIAAVCMTLLQVVLGIILGQWLWPFFWLAVVTCIYLLLPSMRRGYGAEVARRLECDIARWQRRHPRRPGRHAFNLGSPPPRTMPDHWRELW
jgi:hypothetical protein